MTALLRALMIIRRPARFARSGFVLPTTALLVLMVLLTATALTYRAFTRSDQVISQREQEVVSNAATPAIDRAKAKLEFLFRDDPRFPSALPSSDILANLMLPETARIPNADVPNLPGGGTDPFTLPDETRLDINNDGTVDNAWSFQSDVDGDGTVTSEEIIVYSILVDDEAAKGGTTYKIDSAVNQDKANALVTRTGPLATTEATATCSGAQAEAGWQVVESADTSSLQKNFQINAFVANANPVNRVFESYEFQQSRIANRGNKWGAWFRYDLDIYPGPNFNWNGAMHTDGNLLVHSKLNSHMVSSHTSCVYGQESSEITLGEFDYDNDGLDLVNDGDFQGQLMKTAMKFDNFTSESGNTNRNNGTEDLDHERNPWFHLFQGDNNIPTVPRNAGNVNTHEADTDTAGV
jgi:hypothetical protein